MRPALGEELRRQAFEEKLAAALVPLAAFQTPEVSGDALRDGSGLLRRILHVVNA